MKRAECVMTWLLYLTATSSATTTTDGLWMETKKKTDRHKVMYDGCVCAHGCMCHPSAIGARVWWRPHGLLCQLIRTSPPPPQSLL